MATSHEPETNLLALTDCLYFTNGLCAFKKKCHYRHCQTAIKQLIKCPNWPRSCRDVNCPYRHTGPPSKAPKLVPQEKGLVSFFWNIENVPIPRGQRPFDIILRIRQKIVTDAGLQEADFSCYCNSSTLSEENQQSLHHAVVRIVHVPDRKPGAVDRQIMLDLDRFERVHRPPATIVLISGDIDFLGKLSDLRHQAKFHVIVIHNKPAREELKATVHEHYSWEFFTEASQQPVLKATARNNSGGPTILLPDFQPILRDRQNDDRIMMTPTSEKPKPSMVDRRRGSVTRKHRPKDHIQSTKPLMDLPLDQTATAATSGDTSSPIPASAVVRRGRARLANNPNQLNKRDMLISGSCGQIPLAVEESTAKITRPLFPCPYCTNEFSTVKALRQHQTDKNHLFNCSVCKEGFPTAAGLKQHQNTKKHNTTDAIQSDATIDSDKQQSTFEFEHNSNIPIENNVYRNPVANHSTTAGGRNNTID